jgi:SAM-dependent MidA family methyltransferase
MDLALYHPVYGYYRRGIDPFGRHGDFYTAEQLRPFGELVAACVEQSGATEVLELGAGRRDLRGPLARFQYRGIDWYNPLLPERFSGFVVANEFFDALPVHLLGREGGAWFEMVVASEGEAFTIRKQELVVDELREYARRYEPFVPCDAVLEANIQMKTWIDTLARRLDDARVLVIDYGYSAQELPRLPNGTLLSYRKHTARVDVLQTPGERDITCHVNFSELLRVAEVNGLSVLFDGSLRSWALSMWEEEILQQRWSTADEQWKLQWKQLVFGMGETFRVVLLATSASTKKHSAQRRERFAGSSLK